MAKADAWTEMLLPDADGKQKYRRKRRKALDKLVELHLHLDGSLRPETVWELAKEQGMSLPAESLEEVRFQMKVPEDCSLRSICSGLIFLCWSFSGKMLWNGSHLNW